MTTDELGPISADDAIDLLTRTSANNTTGQIGSASGSTYSLPTALALVERASLIIRAWHVGSDLVSVHLPGRGVYSLYLNVEPRKASPWS